jgi:hypothetical protein
MLHNKTEVVEYIINTVRLLFGFRAMAPLANTKSEEPVEQTQHTSTGTENEHQISAFNYVTEPSQLNGNKNIICRAYHLTHLLLHDKAAEWKNLKFSLISFSIFYFSIGVKQSICICHVCVCEPLLM